MSETLLDRTFHFIMNRMVETGQAPVMWKYNGASLLLLTIEYLTGAAYRVPAFRITFDTTLKIYLTHYAVSEHTPKKLSEIGIYSKIEFIHYRPIVPPS